MSVILHAYFKIAVSGKRKHLHLKFNPMKDHLSY